MESTKKILVIVIILFLVIILPWVWLKNKEKKVKTETQNQNQLIKINNKEMMKKEEQEITTKINDKNQKPDTSSNNQDFSVLDGMIAKVEGNLITVKENKSGIETIFSIDDETFVYEVEIKENSASGDIIKNEKGAISREKLEENDDVAVIFHQESKTSEGYYKAEKVARFVPAPIQ